ncbi:MAG: hypothetical protein ACTHJQ_15340 [Rhizobiaceae bacterium]
MEAQIRNYEISLRRLSYHAAALHVLLAGRRIQWLLRKANFYPDEPRVPAGNPDGGQWTTIGGGSYRLPSGARVIRVGGKPHLFRLRPGMLGEDDDLPGFEDFPDIPIVRPHHATDRHSIVRRIPMAPFVGRPAGTLPRKLEEIGAPAWLREYYPHIDAYTQGPKSLSELQAGARSSRPGYDIHHIVEKTPALEEGSPKSLVNGPDNLVSIPRFKHWEITGWYQTKNPKFESISPRMFLTKEDWQARRLIGMKALKYYGVPQ